MVRSARRRVHTTAIDPKALLSQRDTNAPATLTTSQHPAALGLPATAPLSANRHTDRPPVRQPQPQEKVLTATSPSRQPIGFTSEPITALRG